MLWDGLSHAEAAAVLRCSPNALEQRYRRARGAVRAALSAAALRPARAPGAPHQHPADPEDRADMNVEDLIRAANPVATREAPPGTSPLARAILAELPSRRPAPPRPVLRRPVFRLTIAGLAVAGLAAGAVAVALPSAPARPAPSAGHPARPVPAGVRGLVLAAARQPAPPVLAPGQFKYTETSRSTRPTR